MTLRDKTVYADDALLTLAARYVANEWCPGADTAKVREIRRELVEAALRNPEPSAEELDEVDRLLSLPYA